MKKKVLVSSVDGLPIRPSGFWIRDKHYYLTRYMDIFTRGMKKKWGRLTYIDLFAGPGRCLIESENLEKDGSPLISLNYDFDRYIFIEKDPRDLVALKQRCENSPKRLQIQFVEGDCNEVVHKIHLEGLCLAFIDPTGIDIHFDTIAKLTRHRQMDILLNVQFGMDIRRNFPYEGSQRVRLINFLGNADDLKKIRHPKDVISLYRDKLYEAGYSIVEHRQPVIRNSKRAPMYFLLFASKNPRGTEFWKKITEKDESGQLPMF